MHQPENHDLYRFLTGNGVFNVGPYGFPEVNSCELAGMPSFCSSSSYYPLEVSGLADTPPQDRALMALKNHKEAEKRRRERINSHLDKLRSLLPCNSKVIWQFMWVCVVCVFVFLFILVWERFFFFYFSNYGLVKATRLRLGFINMYHVLDFFSN